MRSFMVCKDSKLKRDAHMCRRIAFPHSVASPQPLPRPGTGFTLLTVYSLIGDRGRESCGKRINKEIMITFLFCTVIFYYIALVLVQGMSIISHYISELYLFNIAQNVGYLKRFYGL